MKKTYYISIAITLVGIWILYQGTGEAQNPSISFGHKMFVIALGLVLTAAGYLAYRFARASMQNRNDLEILTKVKTRNK
jgi:hypothetical protein